MKETENVLVEKVMTSEVEACRADNSLSEAAAAMWRRDCGAVPVVDGDGRVVGVITDRDICMALATRGRLASEVKVGEAMSGPARTCTTVDDVREALEVMEREQLRRLPVVDSAGRLAGILSINDIILHSGRGKSKKHISHGDAMAALKAISKPHDKAPATKSHHAPAPEDHVAPADAKDPDAANRDDVEL